MHKKLHIVSFDVPYPPNYGGIIDVFFKIKSLSEIGVEIYLHTFEYGKGKSDELEKYCSKVYYYKRSDSFHKVISRKPYIVNTRESNELTQNLKSIVAPILFEGLHTTFPLIKNSFKDRKVLVRTHNIEHNYYSGLAKSESNFRKKTFYFFEHLKLKNFQKILHKADHILSISNFEHTYFKKKFGDKVCYIPVFHPNTFVKNLSKKGYFAMYHGDLSISDNLKAAQYLIDIFKKIDYPLVIAGNLGDSNLKSKNKEVKNLTFVALDNQEQVADLFKRTHINVLPTFQNTGIKLKLVNALFQSRFCVVTPKMIENTGLENLVSIGANEKSFQREIINLIDAEFSEEDTLQRQILLKEFDCKKNAHKILELLET